MVLQMPQPGRTVAGPGRVGPSGRVPAGFRSVSITLLSGLSELPCDVYLAVSGHAILYTTLGAEAAELARRIADDANVLIRVEDEILFRRFIAGGIRSVLADETLSPAERSRRSYAMASEVVLPLFSAASPVGQEDLLITREAIDAVSDSLLTADEFVWSSVATMQKHLTTHTHAINTAIYAVALVHHLRLWDREESLDVGRGALLHDIGKTRIPARILDKPGPLTRGEWRVMEGHPETGFRLVTRALGTTPGYAHIIAEHHERADGSGYPGGRRSGQVALDSQLVAIVDAFDALTSARSYKAAMTPFEALRVMRFEMAGKFNDQLLQEFIGLLGGWRELRRTDLRELTPAQRGSA